MNARVVWLVAIAACGSSNSSSDPPAPRVVPIPVAAAPEPPRKPSIERRLYPIDVDASSFLEAETRPYVQYHPSYTIDGDPKTAWNEGAPGDGAGEWLRFHVTHQEGVSHVRLRILDGFQYDDAIYKANPRAKTVEIKLLPDGKPHRAVLADQTAWQDIAFSTETPVLDRIELKVVDVYPGARFEDLAISEVEIYVTSQTPEKPDVEKAQLDAILAWKKHQRAMAELASMDAPAIVDSDTEIKMPAAAQPFLDRAEDTHRHSLGGLDELAASVKGDAVVPVSLQDCFLNRFDSGCLAQLFTTSGLKVSVKDATPGKCRPRLIGRIEPDDSIRELVITACFDHSTRAAMESAEGAGFILEYDDDGQLRAMVSEKHTAYFEWGQVGGKRTIVGGAWMATDDVHTYALVRSDK